MVTTAITSAPNISRVKEKESKKDEKLPINKESKNEKKVITFKKSTPLLRQIIFKHTEIIYCNDIK